MRYSIWKVFFFKTQSELLEQNRVQSFTEVQIKLLLHIHKINFLYQYHCRHWQPDWTIEHDSTKLKSLFINYAECMNGWNGKEWRFEPWTRSFSHIKYSRGLKRNHIHIYLNVSLAFCAVEVPVLLESSITWKNILPFKPSLDLHAIWMHWILGKIEYRTAFISSQKPSTFSWTHEQS